MSKLDDRLQQFDGLTKAEHLDNILNILVHNFWSDEEKLFYIELYYRVIMQKEERSPKTGDHLKRLLYLILDEDEKIIGLYYENKS